MSNKLVHLIVPVTFPWETTSHDPSPMGCLPWKSSIYGTITYLTLDVLRTPNGLLGLPVNFNFLLTPKNS